VRQSDDLSEPAAVVAEHDSPTRTRGCGSDTRSDLAEVEIAVVVMPGPPSGVTPHIRSGPGIARPVPGSAERREEVAECQGRIIQSS